MRSDPITGTSKPAGDARWVTGGSISTFTSFVRHVAVVDEMWRSGVASARFAVLRTQVAPRISCPRWTCWRRYRLPGWPCMEGLSVKSRLGPTGMAAITAAVAIATGGDGLWSRVSSRGGGAVGTLSGAGPAIKGDSTALTGRRPGLRTFNRMNTACYDGVHGRDNSTWHFRRNLVVYPHHGTLSSNRRAARDQGEEREYLVLRIGQGDLVVQVPSDNVVWSAFAT